MQASRGYEPYSRILDVVSQRHGDPLPFPDPELRQAPRQRIRVLVEFIVRQARPLVTGYHPERASAPVRDVRSLADHSRVTVAIPPDDGREVLRYGLLEQWRLQKLSILCIAVEPSSLTSVGPAL